MSKTDGNVGSGNAFNQHQKAVDKAINEKIKSEQGDDKIDPAAANNPASRSHASDTAQKKTGGGKQSNPGM
jgi:hypothetical protein